MTTENAPSPPQNKLKVAAVLGVVCGLALAWKFGVFHELGEPARVASTLRGLGMWGYLSFVVAYAVFQPFGVPGTVFVVAAPLIWPWPVAFCLSMVGTMCASVIGFSFARFVARDWIAKKVPAKFHRYDEALEQKGFATVFLLRLIFWMPPLLHAFFGVSKVRFWTHVWGSFCGYLLPLFLVSFFGQRLFDALRQMPASSWAYVALGVAAIAFSVWSLRRCKTRVAG